MKAMIRSNEEILEAKRQIESILHKLRKTITTLETKENPKLKSQITLAKRRIVALEIALELIDTELTKLSKND